jgi:hypothetical protein
MKLQFVALLIFLTSCASMEKQKKSNVNKAKKLSLHHFISHLTVQDDKFIPTATITTGKGFQAKWGMTKMV